MQLFESFTVDPMQWQSVNSSKDWKIMEYRQNRERTANGIFLVIDAVCSFKNCIRQERMLAREMTKLSKAIHSHG